MGEIQYVWADPSSAQQQVALSSIAQAMYEKDVMAIARWVTKDGMDPKMGVLKPAIFDQVDCLLWAQVSMLGFSLPYEGDLACRCHLRTMSVNTRLLPSTISSLKRAKLLPSIPTSQLRCSSMLWSISWTAWTSRMRERRMRKGLYLLSFMWSSHVLSFVSI